MKESEDTRVTRRQFLLASISAGLRFTGSGNGNGEALRVTVTLDTSDAERRNASHSMLSRTGSDGPRGLRLRRDPLGL